LKKTDEDEAAKSKREAEERKKKKRIEQLDKRIKKLMKKHEKDKEIKREPSDIKNKLKRQEVVVRKRQAKEEARVIERLKKKKVREELGEAAMPKGKTNTIESMRVADETLIEDALDEDIKGEQEIDEFSSYFKNLTTPKILMTTNRRPKGGLFQFLKEIKEAIPSVEYYER
jgi:ribosome production factor 1